MNLKLAQITFTGSGDLPVLDFRFKMISSKRYKALSKADKIAATECLQHHVDTLLKIKEEIFADTIQS